MAGQNPAVTCIACGTVATAPGGYCASCGERLPAAPPVMQPAAGPVNPYATSNVAPAHGGAFVQDPQVIQKAEAIIKDGGQVILAVLIGFLCTGIAALVIGPYYIYRLHGWNKLAEECPALLNVAAPPRSLEQRFQAAKAKLIAGVAVGAVLFAIFFGAIMLAVLAG